MKQHGFTLLETLIVLFILSTILVITNVAVTKSSALFIDERTVHQIELDIFWMQTTAQQQRTTSNVYILGTHHYELKHNFKTISRMLPEPTVLQVGTVDANIQYGINGNPRTIGSFRYQGLQREYQFMIHFGRGRVSVE